MKMIALLGLLAFGLVSCGSSGSDPKAWIGMMCSKYEKCGMLQDAMYSAFLGTTAAECQTKMSSNAALNPDPTSKKDQCPNTDINACYDATSAQSCDDMKAGKSLDACACK
jgi:hypothetical protein